MKVVEVEPQTQAVLQGCIVRADARRQSVHQVADAGVQHVRFEVDLVAVRLNFEKDAVTGVNQPTACVKGTAVAAEVKQVEDLTIVGHITIDQIDLQQTVKRSHATDVNLIVKTGSGTRTCATDFKHSRCRVCQGQVVDVLHPRRITRAEHAFNSQITRKCAAAFEHRIRRQQPQ